MKPLILLAVCLNTIAHAMKTSESEFSQKSHLHHRNGLSGPADSRSASENDISTEIKDASNHRADVMSSSSSSDVGKHLFPSWSNQSNLVNGKSSIKYGNGISAFSTHNVTMEVSSKKLDITSTNSDGNSLSSDLFESSGLTSSRRNLASVSEGDDYVSCGIFKRWRIFAEDDNLVGSPEWSVCELELYSDPACTDLVATTGQAPIYFASGPGVTSKQEASKAFDGDLNTCWPGVWQNNNKKEYFLGYDQGLVEDVNVKCIKLVQGPNNYMTSFKLQYQQGQWKDQFEITGVDSSTSTFVLDSSPSCSSQSLCDTYFRETTNGGILANVLDQEYGRSVSISGDGQRAAVTGSVSNIFGPIQGLVEVWQFDGSTWNQLGQTIYTAVVSVRVSAEVELSGDGNTLAFATVYNDDQDVSIGAVSLFKYNEGTSQWDTLGNQITGGVAGNRAGLKVSLSDNGEVVAIGSRYYSSNTDQEVGRARVFQYDAVSDDWDQLGSDIVGDTAQDHVGSAVALTPDGLHVVVGATGYDYFGGGTSMTDVGYVRVYSYIASEWVKLGNDIIGEGEGDKSGFSVAIAKTASLTRVVIGAIFNDGNGIDAGHARVYDYDISTDTWDQAGSDIDGQNGQVLDENTYYYHVGTCLPLTMNSCFWM